MKSYLYSFVKVNIINKNEEYEEKDESNNSVYHTI